MDPEFQRILGRVLLVGGAMGLLSAGVLVIAFRAFGGEEGGKSGFRGAVGIVALLALVLVCCAVLLLFSIPRQG